MKMSYTITDMFTATYRVAQIKIPQ